MGAILWLYALSQARRKPPGPKTTAPPAEQPKAVDNGWQARIARLPVIGVAWRVNKRFGELKGNNLAAAITFQSFLSLFPLLLVVVAAVGFVASGDATVGPRIISKLGLTGDAASTINDAIKTAASSPKVAGPIGLAGLLWSGLGLVNALQYGLDQVWQVEERGIKDKAFGALWLLGAAALFVAGAGVTALLNFLPGVLAPLAIVIGLLVNFALWVWTFRVLPNRRLPWAAVFPGAIVAAIGMEVLKVVGGVYLPRTIASSSALYGSIGVVFAVLAWLLLFSRLMLYSAVFNVIRWEERAGTVETTVAVPAGPGVQPSDEASRTGRVDAAA